MGSSTSNMSQMMVMNPANEVSVVDSDSCQKALNNSVVLRTIMNNLNARDLLQIRFVSKKWEEEATIQLLKTQSVKPIWFNWDWFESDFRQKLGTLEEFTNCLKDSRRKFPCSHFKFYGVTTSSEVEETPSDLSRFLLKYGHHIKSLNLNSSRNSASALEILRKIIKQTPGLKSLTLDVDLYKTEQLTQSKGTECKSSSDSSLNSSSSNLNLGHLQEIRLISRDLRYHDDGVNLIAAQRCSLFIQDILSSAPNLKQISDPHLWFQKELVSSGRIGLNEDLHAGWGPESVTSRIVEFSRIRPQLKNLKIELEYFDRRTLTPQSNPSNDFLQSLQIILQSSRKTLKTLEIIGRIDLLKGTPTVNIPIMENLQEFVIVGWQAVNGERGRFLPEGCSLQESFPRLKILSLQDFGHDKYVPTQNQAFEESSNSSTTVQVLSIYPCTGDPLNNFMHQARIFYPNVRVLNLEIPNHTELPTVLVKIWSSWKESQLEELSVVSHFEDNGDRRPFLDDSVPERERNQQFAQTFDQALTGFDEKTCKTLNNVNSFGLCQGGEGLERGPSILDMKSLNLFQLQSFEDYPFPSYPVFSPVSVIHAFEPMRKRQNLRVKINSIDLENLLVPFDVNFAMCRT